MSKINILVWTIVALLAFTIAFISKDSYLFPKQSVFISPNILYLTAPIKSFTGNIQKIGKDNIIVVSKNLSYKVYVTPKTKILKMPEAKEVNIKKLTVGKAVSVSTNADLRILKKSEFEALTVIENINLYRGW